MKAISFFLLAVAVSLTSARAGDSYGIDPNRSSISFGVHQFLGVTKGKFTRFSGTIEVDREHPELSSVKAQIQVSSIDTGIRKRDDHLCSAEFFDAGKYPQITFKSRSVKQTGQNEGDILGDLTMHGVTRPMTLHVKLLTPLSEGQLPAQTRWSVTVDPIRRRDFGLMFSSTAEAVSGIGQDVTAEIRIEATGANEGR
jgi:polyisoprenoid-binding protein YceI